MFLAHSWSEGPGFRGSNELRRYSTVYYARSCLRLFGRNLNLGDQHVVTEVVYAMGGTPEYSEAVERSLDGAGCV